jgi:hypothetical protein
MKKQLFSILLASLFISATSVAQNDALEDVKATQKLSYEISKLFKEGNFKEAFDKMDPYLPLPAEEKADLRDQTIKYQNMLTERFGERYGFTRASEKRIADVAIRESYLIQYEFHALRLIFIYYKSPQGWILNSFKWDDSFSEEFE